MYVTGWTSSDGWATPGAYDTIDNGGDAFVAKLDASGSSLLYATYLGGNGDRSGIGIAVDGSGNAYVTGAPILTGWATEGAYDTTYNGEFTPRCLRGQVDATGSSLLYATYLGGSGDNVG